MYKGSTMRLQIPYSQKSGKYFSFHLQTNLINEPSEYMAPAKILLLSDIEGNFLALQQLLVRNGVIDRNHQWIFKDGHLVIAGDCFDRGEQVIECLWLIYSLEQRAKRAGGHVHFILGNHEIMNINGDWRYVHPRYALPRNEKTLITALYDGNNALWHWLHTKNIMEKIGNILIVHGGISSSMNGVTHSISDINAMVRPYYKYTGQTFSDPLLQLIFNSDDSPLWYRGYYQGTATEEQVNVTLANFGVQTIITGHTIVDTISTYFNGKVINLNTNHAAGKSEALLIKNKRFYKVNSEGKKERLR